MSPAGLALTIWLGPTPKLPLCFGPQVKALLYLRMYQDCIPLPTLNIDFWMLILACFHHLVLPPLTPSLLFPPCLYPSCTFSLPFSSLPFPPPSFLTFFPSLFSPFLPFSFLPPFLIYLILLFSYPPFMSLCIRLSFGNLLEKEKFSIKQPAQGKGTCTSPGTGRY